MRKRCVVVVSLFIVLCFGFIVPSGIAETLHNVTTSLSIITKENVSEQYLEQLTNINETDLYENGGDKNNVSERSFIYLNQRFKKPYLHELYKTLIPGLVQPIKLREKMSKTYMPHISYMAAPQGLPLISQKLLFVPNGIISEQSYGPAYPPNNHYQHPDPLINSRVSQNNQETEATRVELNFDLMEAKPTFEPTLHTNENVDERYLTRKEEMNIEPVQQQHYQSYNNPYSIVTVNPGYYNGNIHLTSANTQRKPIQNNNLYKANEFQPSTKKYESYAQRDFINNNKNRPHLDPHSNYDYDDKFVRFVKETLAENEIQLIDDPKSKNSAECNKIQDCVEAIDNNDTVELSESTNLEDAIKKLFAVRNEIV